MLQRFLIPPKREILFCTHICLKSNLIFFNKVRKGRKSSDMSSDFWSRSRGPSEYTISPLKKKQFKSLSEGRRDLKKKELGGRMRRQATLTTQ